MKRSKWKGPFIQKQNFNSKTATKLPRNFEITLNMINTVCQVYSGKKWVNLVLTEDMIGHKLGEFVSTRVKFVFKKKKKK